MVNDENEVHVITCGSQEYNEFSNDRGVNVHRVNVRGPRCADFIMWVMQLSHAMLEKAIELIESGIDFDVVHDIDIAEYPDSVKIGIWGMGINEIYPRTANVEYYDGE